MTSSVVEHDDGRDAPREQAGRPSSPPHSHPTGLTVLLGGVSVSYEEAEVASLAAALVTAGVRPHERVLIVMPDGSGFAEAVIGTIRQGAGPVPVDPAVPVDELHDAATEAGARLVVVPARRCRELDGLPTELIVPVHGPHGQWAAVLSLAPR